MKRREREREMRGKKRKKRERETPETTTQRVCERDFCRTKFIPPFSFPFDLSHLSLFLVSASLSLPHLHPPPPPLVSPRVSYSFFSLFSSPLASAFLIRICSGTREAAREEGERAFLRYTHTQTGTHTQTHAHKEWRSSCAAARLQSLREISRQRHGTVTRLEGRVTRVTREDQPPSG